MKKEKSNSENAVMLRKKAEQILNEKKKNSKKTEPLKPDVEKLIHELEVHQIELEMQNDELRKAQLVIENSRAKYFDLYNLAPVCYLTLDVEGKILDLNLTTSKLLGYERIYLIGSDVYEHIVKADRDIFYLHHVKLLETKSKQSCEMRLYKKDGTEFYAQLISVLFQDENNNVLGCKSVIIDITERKQAEKVLLEERVFSQSIIDTTQAIILILDPDGTIISINPYMELLTGYCLDEVKEKDWFDTFIPAPARDTIRKLFKTTVKNTESKGYVNPIVSKDGKELSIEWYNKLLKDEDGNILYLLCTGHDITERLQSEAEIKISKERLKTINMILRHDLTNDLAVIRSAIRIYKLQSDSKMLEEIEKRVEKSLKTINRLRKQESFIDSHNSLSEYEISEIINTLIKEYPALEIKLEGTGTVFADERIYSVFENLINNAVNHGKTKKLKISISSSESFYEIRFTDYGKGIPVEIMLKVFEEGFTYSETGHTGIGLYIVSKIIEEYGGKIYCEANNPTGVTFVINLRKVE